MTRFLTALIPSVLVLGGLALGADPVPPALPQTVDVCSTVSAPPSNTYVAQVGKSFILGFEAPYPPKGTDGSTVSFSLIEGASTIVKNYTQAEVTATALTPAPGCWTYQVPAPAFATPGDRTLKVRAYSGTSPTTAGEFADSGPITVRVFALTAPVNLRAIVTINNAGSATLQVYVPDRTAPISSSTIDLTQLLLGQLTRDK